MVDAVGERGRRAWLIVSLKPEKRLVWATPLADGRDTVVLWEVSPWKWTTNTVTRLALTLNDVPSEDAPAVAAVWMRRLHDLADAALG